MLNPKWSSHMAKPLNILISGGGTGGHIYPAVSIADELRSQFPDAKILFVGARDRMEMERVPKAGYEIVGLNIAGLQRSLSAKNLSFPFKLAGSLIKARKIVRDFNPDIAIGTGGYASGPTLWAAQKAGIPTLIQEQNSYPGITNKLLAKGVDKICVAYEGLEKYFPVEKIVFTGNPVRSDLFDVNKKRDEAIAHFGLQKDRKTLLVIGGSLGARAINERVAKRLIYFQNSHIQLIWQCGRLYEVECRKAAKEYDNTHVYPFLERMDLAYAASDITISRAGAGTLSELALVGKPVMLIPSPNVAEDHQKKNALSLVEADAAVMVEESEWADGGNSKISLGDLLGDTEFMSRLGDNIKQLAKPNATKDIVEEIKKLVHRGS